MLRLYIILIISSVIIACNEPAKEQPQDDGRLSTDVIKNPKSLGDKVDSTKLPILGFDALTHDFDTISEGQIVEHIFHFVNSGKSSLIISEANGSCGCTVPEWPKDKIEPGDSSLIRVSFNSSGKSGPQNTTVTIKANTVPNTHKLEVKAFVEKMQ